MIITLLTDFGVADSYVAEMKGVLLSRAPQATLIDISHAIAPGDVRAGQYVLSRTWHQFPRGTVHIAVVDPGVGTERRALAAESGGHFFLAPDNGLLSFLPGDTRFVSLPVRREAAPTFHGRDLFAPAAAVLATGEPLGTLGTAVIHPVRAPLPVSRREGTATVGAVIYVDHFGTLISNIPAAAVGADARVRVGGSDVGPVRRTFADVPRGALVAFVGSGGTVEIAVRDGRAADVLGASIGTEVRAENK